MESRSGGTPPSGQSGEPGSPPPRSGLVWAAGWAAILAVPLWIARLSPLWIAVAAVALVAWTIPSVRRRDGGALVVAALLALSLGLAGGAHLRLVEIARDWPAVELSVEERAANALNLELDDLVERGEVAVAGLETSLGGGAPAREGLALFNRLEHLRISSGVQALAIFDVNGVAVGWAGEHRGTVPSDVRRGERRYIFEQGPLFSYLYFVRPLAGGHTAMAAMLLEAQVRVGEGTIPFAERFDRRHGIAPRFLQPDRARGETIWDWSTDRPILSVSFATLTQQHWWERVVERGRLSTGVAWLTALLAMSTLWYRGRTPMPGLPVAVATAGLLLLPLGQTFAADSLFSPLRFVLPLPVDVTLGMLLILLVGAAVWLQTRGAASVSLPPWVAAAGAAALFPAVLLLMERSASGGLLAGAAAGGLPLQLATVLALAIPLRLLLASRPGTPGKRGGVSTFAGLALALALGAVVVLAWHPERPVHVGWAALWAIPFLLVARGHVPARPRRRPLRRWLLAVWLAASAALPFLWAMHMRAELAAAEGEIARLGTETDPFLNFLLRQFSERATAYAAAGEAGVNLLYHSWVSSGLAGEGYEARLTIWRGGEPETELRLSEVAAPPSDFADLVAVAGPDDGPFVERFTDVEGLHYLLLVPLDDGRVISVAVPPRYRLGRATALARYLQPRGGADSGARETLNLVPITPEEEARVEAGLVSPHAAGVEWTRVQNGWRSEARSRFPSGWMHAHLTIRSTPLPLLGVRALLLLIALLATAVLLHAWGRMLCGDLPALAPLRRAWLRSFRGRLTLALFLFFLAPMAVFGAAAYSAVAREVVRTAGVLAHRSLEQAAREIPRSSLAEVGGLVGVDLLLFREGALVGAAAPEVLDLGIFHTWLPPEVYLGFARGEDLEDSEERRVAGNDYLIAYRRLDPSVVLAAPLPLASDEITRRQRDFAHVALLASLLGAAFSVFLSLLVGRALTRPLDELGRAVATVGTGDLRVRLPEGRGDEFGSVYAAFNNMVQRIHRARAALVRETRRTETIVAEAATGVLALDARGRVELVNPRAAEILGAELAPGETLPRDAPLLDSLASAVESFLSTRASEEAHELEVDGRIVRLRLRRLRGRNEARGAVVALEDVTDEVRTARVLAWGEMARQVAHEIKNPLTPIKLSVQHLRRAHLDRRPDFGEILDRNVDAVLREIDRLGDIARAFARFGTPQEASSRPGSVELLAAVDETLALYRSGDGAIGYAVTAPDPPVHVRAHLGELKEVLVNLLENAREAMHGAGEIRIAVRRLDEKRVEMVVEDSGEGIPPEVLGTIFEPHFSTRTSGTGLGLAIVRRLVESWGASVQAESEPEVGTRFRIVMLAAEPPEDG
jgi:two-component system, NtrC family, nitrogen regulation sensor histidine kinase NtrY